MRSCILLFRLVFVSVIVLAFIPGVSGWALQNWSVTPAGAELPPGTPVTASYSLYFNSWATGSTFEKDNSLIMYTELADPHWSATKVEPMDDQPDIIEQVPVRQAGQVRFDGWVLSYSRKDFYLNVQLTGKTPALNQTTTIPVVKLQEMTAGAKPISSSVVKKEVVVIVPTQTPVYTPVVITLNTTPAEIIEVTPEPALPSTPVKKVTYSPGPDYLLVTGLLAALAMVVAVAKRKN